MALSTTINKIHNLMLSQCKHLHYSYGHQVYSCNTICELINGVHNSNKQLDKNTCDLVMNYITKFPDSYYSKPVPTCLTKNLSVIVPVLSNMFQYYVPKIEKLTYMLNIDYLIRCVTTLFTVNKESVHIRSELFDEIIKKNLRHNNDSPVNQDCYHMIMSSVFQSDFTVDCTEGVPKHMLSVRNTKFNRYLSKILDKSHGIFTQEDLEHLCKNLPFTQPVLMSLLSKGLVLNSTCLENVCRYCNDDSINYVLDIGRTPITKVHFQALITSQRYIGPDPEQRPYYYKPITDEEGFSLILSSGCSNAKIETLIKHGYIIDYDDVGYAIKHKIEIPDVNRFDIKFDQNMLEKCWNADFYPKYYKFDCITNSMLELQQLCMKRANSQILALIKKHKLVPDKKCMENASSFKSNVPCMRNLIANGGKVTLQCVKNCAQHLNTNDMLMLLLTEFEKHYNTLLNKKETPEQEIIDDKPEEIIDDEINEDEIDDEINEDEIDEELEEEHQFIDLEDYSQYTPKQPKRKCKIPVVYAKLFNKKLSEKISYVDLKKEFMLKVRDDSWYDHTNKQLVNPPINVRTVLDLPLEGYIRFDDLEKLVAYFYKKN